MKKSNVLTENVLEFSAMGLSQLGSMKTINVGSAGVKNDGNGNWITVDILGIIDLNTNGIEYCCSYILKDNNNYNHYFRWNYDEVVEVIEALREKYNFTIDEEF